MIESPIQISANLTVGPQLTADQLQTLAASGIKTIVNLSKKGEFKQSMKPDEEKSLAEELGLAYAHEPLSVSDLKPRVGDQIFELIKDAEHPVYMHCCFGQRAGPLGIVCNALRNKLSADKALLKAKKLGVDLTTPILRSFVTTTLSEQK